MKTRIVHGDLPNGIESRRNILSWQSSKKNVQYKSIACSKIFFWFDTLLLSWSVFADVFKHQNSLRICSFTSYSPLFPCSASGPSDLLSDQLIKNGPFSRSNITSCTIMRYVNGVRGSSLPRTRSLCSVVKRRKCWICLFETVS